MSDSEPQSEPVAGQARWKSEGRLYAFATESLRSAKVGKTALYAALQSASAADS